MTKSMVKLKAAWNIKMEVSEKLTMYVNWALNAKYAWSTSPNSTEILTENTNIMHNSQRTALRTTLTLNIFFISPPPPR